MALGIEGGRVRAHHTLRAGERLYCSLSWAEGLASAEDFDDATRRLDATTRFWRDWLGRARLGPGQPLEGCRDAPRQDSEQNDADRDWKQAASVHRVCCSSA